MKRKAALAAAALILLSGCGSSTGSVNSGKATEANGSIETYVVSADPQTCAPTATSAPETTAAPETTTTSATETASSSATSATTVTTTPPTSATTSSPDEEKPKPQGLVKVFDANVSSQDKFDEYLAELEELVTSKLGYKAGIAYENLSTGARIQFNANKQFFTASTIKAPYVKCLLEKDIDLNEKITLKNVWDDGDPSIGQIVPSDEGKEFTAKALVEKTIQLSDNSAYNNLVQHYGINDFNALMERLGVSMRISFGNIFRSATAAEQCRLYKDIYEFSQNNSSGKYLIALLENCETNVQIGRSLGVKYPVAQKYGAEYDYEPQTYNDCAICYAQKPFVLCILTEQYPNTDTSNAFFLEASVIFDKINSLMI